MMAASDDVLSLLLIHGSTKHELKLPKTDPDLNVSDLIEAIATVTEVQPENQRIIYKGKSLTDKTSTLRSLGMKSGNKVMMIGKKSNPTDDERWKEIDRVEVKVDKASRKLTDVRDEVTGLKQGFLTVSQQQEALRILEKKSASCAEEFARDLEQLDKMSLGDSAQEIRTKRKKLVDKIQVSLSQCDKINEEIQQISSSTQR